MFPSTSALLRTSNSCRLDTGKWYVSRAAFFIVSGVRTLFLFLQKCIPASPRCTRCTGLGIEDCIYETGGRTRGPGGTLRMGEACTSCRFVLLAFTTAHSKLTDLTPFPRWFILVRRKKRVSRRHHSTSGFRTTCILKFSRDAMHCVRARRVSMRAGVPGVFTMKCGRLITSSDRFPPPLILFRFWMGLNLGLRTLDRSRSGRLGRMRWIWDDKPTFLIHPIPLTSTLWHGTIYPRPPKSRQRPTNRGIRG